MERPLPADLVLELNTHRLLLLGTRQFPDAERLGRSLGPPDRRLRRVSPWPFDYEELPPSPAERAVLALCTRSVSVADLLALPLPRPELVRAVYAAPGRGPRRRRSGPRRSRAPRSRAALGLRGRLAASAAGDGPAAHPGSSAPADAGGRRAGGARSPREGLPPAGDRDPAGGRRPPPRGAWTPPAARDDPGARGRASSPRSRSSSPRCSRRQADDVELRYALASYYRRSGHGGARDPPAAARLSTDSGHAGAWRDLGELEAGETRAGPPLSGSRRPRSGPPRSRVPAPGRRRGRRPRSPCRRDRGRSRRPRPGRSGPSARPPRPGRNRSSFFTALPCTRVPQSWKNGRRSVNGPSGEVETYTDTGSLETAW